MASTIMHRPSPSGSPALRPIPFSVPSPGPSPLPLFPASASPRSYARAPPQRPYALSSSSRSMHKVQPIDGDTRAFAQLVVELIEARAKRIRAGAAAQPAGTGDAKRKGQSLGNSLSGSWETERAELIVDIPVWSPGCFQDLSTLHALRDTTLAHTHSLLAYLMTTHGIPASYRLLPRSATNGPNKINGKPNCHHQVGWGCIRLAPSITSPIQNKRELKPAVRRTSSVLPRRPSVSKSSRRSSRDLSTKPSGGRGDVDDVPPFRLDLDSAIMDEDEEEDVTVELKAGYRSGSSSDDECEEECADVLVANEVERRGTKEGEAFLMTLFGAPALILC